MSWFQTACKKNVPHFHTVNDSENLGLGSIEKREEKLSLGFKFVRWHWHANQLMKKSEASNTVVICLLLMQWSNHEVSWQPARANDGNKEDVAVTAATPKRARLGNAAPAALFLARHEAGAGAVSAVRPPPCAMRTRSTP